jgi:multisubunit Na+/H+ antiporter MnhG subunit
MDFDWSSLLGAGALLAIVIPILVSLIGFVILYLIVRAAVRGGLRDHQRWMEKNQPAHLPGHHALPTADGDYSRPM